MCEWIKKKKNSQLWWLMPVILAFKELRQETFYKVGGSYGYRVKLYYQKMEGILER